MATELTLDWSTDDTVRHLRASSVFRNLDAAMLRAIAEAATILLVSAGDAVIEEGDHVAVLEKTAEAESPRPSAARSADAWLQAALQPLTSRVRRLALRARGR